MPALAPARPQSRGALSPETPGSSPSAPSRDFAAEPGLPLFLQRKANGALTVNAPGDRFEHEADQVADTVMRKCACDGNQASATAAPCPTCAAEPQLQTKRAFPEVPDASPGSEEQGEPDLEGAGPAAAAEGREALPQEAADAGAESGKPTPLPKIKLPEIVERRPRSEDEPAIQTKSDGSVHAPGPSVAAGLSRSQGGGQPLDARTRTEMEGHFDRDFGNVRVHTDGDASEMNRSLGARAFTHRGDLYFNSGEYQPTSENGKRLLAHELTHTAQQGTSSDRIQRFTAPEHEVETEPRPEVPNDGAEVTGRMNEKIENDPNVQEADDLDEEERREAEKPNRAEVRSGSSALNASGESSPSVDRGAAAEEKTNEERAAIDEQVQSQADEASEEEGGAEKEKAQLSESEAAAQAAEAALQAAHSVEIPEEPEPFRHPRIEPPVDSAGEPLPRSARVDTQVRGLGYIGEMLRGKGYEMKRHAAEQEIGSYGLDSVLEREREDLANATEGTATMEAHNLARHEIEGQSRQAHSESVERQSFVAEKAPDLAGKADEGKADSSELAAEARGRADQSQAEIPDDPDAREDAEQQSSEMGDTARGAESMDEAITQTGERARQYQQDAALASEQNLQSEAHIAETEDITAQTDARIADMHAANAASLAQIEDAAAGPALIRRHARQTAQSGVELIGATIVMEGQLISLQETYLAEMLAIESKEAAMERLQREQEEASQAQLSPDEQTLAELAGMSDEEQQARIAEMGQDERDRLLAALEAMIAQTPEESPAAEEGGRIRVETGLSQAIMGEQPPDPRAPEIQEVENRRTERVGGVLDVADQNMTFLTAEQQRMLANRLVAQSISDDIGSINVLQLGKEMLKGLLDPRMSLVGVVGGFEKMLSGFANIGNWEAWRRDPLGNLLQIAADITTGLATIFSSILGIAAIITALMVVLTIASWGFLAWFTGPVIGWMGTIMTYAGWGALITGGLAVYFNYLAYIKNLHDAGTADTARELFTNTDEMKQNATDGFQGAMAVVEGVAAVKMGPKLSSGEFFANVPRSPGAWARQTAQSVRNGLAAAAAAPGKLAIGARRLLAGGKQGLLSFKERLQRFFSRRRPGDVGIETPQARQRHDADLAEAQSRSLRDMDEGQFRAEVEEAATRRPRRVDPDSQYGRDYDVEIQVDGHTYRRRRDGRGWCRFSDEDCFINLPPDVRRRLGVDEDFGDDLVDESLIDDPALERELSRRARREPQGRQAQQEAVSDIREGGELPVRQIREGAESKRTTYMGANPAKTDPAGQTVIARMRADGRITGTSPNEQVYHPGTKRWYHIDECDMGHRKDAVKFWNEEGRFWGPRHPPRQEMDARP